MVSGWGVAGGGGGKPSDVWGGHKSHANNASPLFLPTQGARASLSSGCQSSALISRGKKAIPQVIPQTFIKDRMRGRNCARPTRSRRDQSTPDLQTRTEDGIMQEMYVNASRSPRRCRLTRGEGYCVATLTWFANTERKVTGNSARRLQPATGSVGVPGCGRALRPNPETPPPGRANSN